MRAHTHTQIDTHSNANMYRHYQPFSRREMQCHFHCCVNLVCLFFSSSSSIFLLSCPPTVHPFIPDPVIFWSISKRQGEEGGRAGKNLRSTLLFLCFPLSPLLASPCPPSHLFFTHSGFCHDKTLLEDSLFTCLKFNSAWLHTCVQYMYTQMHNPHQCDKHINAGH